MNYYRLSIAWARVLPDGDVANINEEGLAYYDKVINSCLEKSLDVMVTMCHYDYPQEFVKFGGLTNSIFIEYFESYANLLFDRFGKRVKYWITFNEPIEFCTSGYGSGLGPPMIKFDGIGEYLCSLNVLKAHAVAYRLYENRYKEKFNGKIGITLDTEFFYGNETDVDRSLQFHVSKLFK